ncbi:hypothetical protein QBC43DRAFT_287432 [Cladorrhinum sp. PSN259]|nr:hypothetical protein QBC43DRAFT_287432 [Cladorrhinum sp. PSN259]
MGHPSSTSQNNPLPWSLTSPLSAAAGNLAACANVQPQAALDDEGNQQMYGIPQSWVGRYGAQSGNMAMYMTIEEHREEQHKKEEEKRYQNPALSVERHQTHLRQPVAQTHSQTVQQIRSKMPQSIRPIALQHNARPISQEEQTQQIFRWSDRHDSKLETKKPKPLYTGAQTLREQRNRLNSSQALPQRLLSTQGDQSKGIGADLAEQTKSAASTRLCSLPHAQVLGKRKSNDLEDGQGGKEAGVGPSFPQSTDLASIAATQGSSDTSPSSSDDLAEDSSSLPACAQCHRCENFFLIISHVADTESLEPLDEDLNRSCPPCYVRIALCSAATEVNNLFRLYKGYAHHPVDHEARQNLDIRLSGIANDLCKMARTEKARLLLTHFDLEKNNSWVRLLQNLRKTMDQKPMIHRHEELADWRPKIRRWILMLTRCLIWYFFPYELATPEFREKNWKFTCNGSCVTCKSNRREQRAIRDAMRGSVAERPNKFNVLMTYNQQHQVQKVTEEPSQEVVVPALEQDNFVWEDWIESDAYEASN